MTKQLHIAILFSLMYTCGLIAQSSKDTILVGIHEDPPFIFKNKKGNYEGISVALWEDIAQNLDQPFVYKEFSDDIGIIRALDYEELDLSINPLLNSPVRMAKFNVTQPFYVSKLGVAITSSSQSQFQIFISNFFSRAFLNVILLLLLILLSFGTLLWLLERKHNKYQFRPGVKGLLDGLWWAAVTMTTVGYGDKAPKTHAGKTLAIIWMFTAVIIISSFTATIATTLTVNTLAADIKGIADLATVDKIGIVGASDSEDYLFEHNMSVHEIYRTPDQGLRALARGEIDCLVHDRIQMEYLIRSNKLETKINLLPFGFDNRYRSFMMPKSQAIFYDLNLKLIEIIQEPTWEEVLSNYTSEIK